ncbi:MAG: carbon storage regulator [Planctomycetaceae bacterium]|nr:carbon storage regulator [Planctomycetaceae bacterium]
MRVLTRQVNEGVVIGDDVEVTVLEVASDYVRIGITSPHTDPPYQEQTLHYTPKEVELPEAIRQRFQF